MSELLEAASSAMGIPGPLVSRSAAARATEAGVSADEILAAWAGGAPAPAAASAPTTDGPATGEEGADAGAPDSPEAPPAPPEPAPPAFEPPAAPSPAAATTTPGRPPVLVGADDNPMKVFAGAVGLFLIVLFVGIVGPATPTDIPGARSGQIGYSTAAENGRAVYAGQGCAFCHTQMVRPVVADAVGLGPATLNDTNQVIGIRRFGPDLADVGARLGADDLAAIVTGAGGHPSMGLGGEDLQELVAYLAESRTSR